MKGSSKVSGEIRREQIAQATLRIIASKGVSGLTTAVIAKEVGISEGNLYRHFRNKEEILAVTMEKIKEGLRSNLEKVSASGAATSPLAKLKKAFMLHLEYVLKNGGIPRLIFSEELHIGNEELKKTLLDFIEAYTGMLESMIREGQKDRTIKKDIDPRAAALTVIGMVQVMVLKWSLSGFSFPLVPEGMKLWKSFEKSIGQSL